MGGHEKPFPPERLKEYAAIAGQEEVDELCRLGESLKGLKVQHVNSARFGGGVAEMLHSLIPLERYLGLDATWEVIEARQEFFLYTKTLHNFLQGKPSIPDLLGTKIYWDTSRENAPLLRREADIVFIHDPQPAGLIEFVPPGVRKRQKWLWRCHIHPSHELDFAFAFLRSLIEKYDVAVYSSGRFLPPWPMKTAIILPYIDPLSEKNRELPEEEVREVCRRHGLEDPERKPLLLLVSRFDPFKGHDCALEAFKMVRKEHPCQLLMVGGTASDDPENEAIFARLQEKAHGLPDVHLLNLPPDSHREINAFQRAASVILQPSIKEGFGLTVCEGMWKGKAVIGGDTGGISGQITDGYNGFLVPPGEKGSEEMARRISYLLLNPSLAAEMGRRAKKTVKERFLITRGARDELVLFKEVYTGRRS